MTDIEQRLRESLTARAADVEPTPELWREVDRRIVRRRRFRVAAWSLTGAAALVAGVLVLPGLLGTSIDVPEIDPVQVPPSPGEGDDDTVETPADDEAVPDAGVGDPDDTPGSDPGETDGADPAGPDGRENGGVRLETTLLVGTDGELRLREPGGERLLATLAEEGESFIVDVAVRPGSSPDDLTAVVLTQAEGMWDLRTLRVDGDAVTLEVFPEAYRPGRGGSPAGEGLVVRGPVWSPDGSSLAWLESGTGGVVVQTVGWSDGPGTGAQATDNAQWDVSDVLPPGSVPHDWIATEGQSTAIRATMADSSEGWYAVTLDRQPDDAWVLRGAEVVPLPAEEPGTVAAVAGVLDAATDDADPVQPRWVLRTTAEGGQLLDRRGATVRVIDLPAELLAGDGFAQPWLVPVVGGVLIGNAGAGATFLVLDGGEAVRLDGTVAVADAL